MCWFNEQPVKVVAWTGGLFLQKEGAQISSYLQKNQNKRNRPFKTFGLIFIASITGAKDQTKRVK